MKKLSVSILSLGILLTGSFPASAKQPAEGYRGFVEWSSEYRTERFYDYQKREGLFYTGVTTVHGCQLNPMLFVGAGIGINRCNKIDNWIAPVFADGRVDFKFGHFTPFADLRLGYNLAQGGGVYFSPSVGYRISLGRNVGLNFGLGLVLSGYKVEIYDIHYPDEDNGMSYEITYKGSEYRTRPYFTFRVGLDF